MILCAKMALDAFSTRFADERNSIGCINDARSTPCFERGRDDAIVERSAIRKVTWRMARRHVRFDSPLSPDAPRA
jgi:hypothetical protein